MDFSRKLKQTITYWQSTGHDRFGKPTFSAPVTLQGRWENRIENVMGKGGDTITSKAKVFLEQELDIDGYLFEGTSVSADPTIVENAAEIQSLGSIPNLRNSQKLYVAYL